MPYNGIGIFEPPAPPNFPAVPGELIKASEFNAVMADVFNGLSQASPRDGQGPATQFELDLASTAAGKGAAMVSYAGNQNYAVGTIGARLADDVDPTAYPWLCTGNGTTDDSAAIAAADSYAVSKGARLLFKAGYIFKCKGITLHDIHVKGAILSFGATYADSVILAGSIDADDDKQVFSHSVSSPTNLPGTTVPFRFSTASTHGSRVSVKWFGCKGDGVTDDTAAGNVCTTAMSFSICGGTPYAPLRGPVEMFFPRGNYVIAGTLNVCNGTLMRGVQSGSNPLSTLIRDEVSIGSASAASMIWMVKDNQNYTANPTQAFFENLSFVWRPTSDFSSSTLQLETAFVEFKAQAISVKVSGCWFLGSPQKGSVFSWGNNYAKDGSGVGIVKVNTAADSDGIQVDMSLSDTWFDVIYGTMVNVYDKGWGFFQGYNLYLWQVWMGFASNYSTHSTNRLLFSIDGGTAYGVNVQLAPQYKVPSTGAVSGTVWKELRNMDIFLNNLQIYSKRMSGQNFCFTNYLVNSNMRMVGCFIDSTDITALYSTQMFKLDWKANSLTLIGNEFFGGMTPNPATITAPWPKAMISKLSGSVSDNGITSTLHLSGNKIDIGTMDYFIDKETAYSQITNFYCCDNYIPIASTKFAFNLTGVTKYLMARNTWANTANSLETIP